MSQKIKKKSTFIDMTAMSDVTVLLLTFFRPLSTLETVAVETPAAFAISLMTTFIGTPP